LSPFGRSEHDNHTPDTLTHADYLKNLFPDDLLKLKEFGYEYFLVDLALIFNLNE
jgi:hypothetical protein